MTLNILSLPGGNITKVTDLTTVKTGIYSSPAPGNPSFEALRAISERQSYAWSPDGLRLAFVGLMDGPSAELYVYDERLYKVKRVSHDDAEDFAPSWSPDGNHLLYLAADGFGTGAGMVMSGVWSAAGDGSGATRLYATQSSGEEIKGWLNNTTVLLDTWTIDCGSSHLRLYDVVTRKQTMLSNDCINSAAAGRGRGEAMYSNDNGLYLLTADNPTPVLADQEPNARIEPWGPDNYAFTVRLQSGLLATYGSDDMDHQVSPVPASADGVNVAMYGAIWGWTSQDAGNPGTWITGPGVDIGRIFDGKASFPAWDPHNNLMFFAPQDAGGYDIYLTTFDAHYTDLYKVNYIDADVNNVVWLGPR